jgi:excisionase family DNA binding protein
MASAESGNIRTPFRKSTDVDPSDAPTELLTVQEAAHFLKVPVSWLYEHVRPDRQDRVPVVKLGKYLRFDRRDLEAYIDANRVEFHGRTRRR